MPKEVKLWHEAVNDFEKVLVRWVDTVQPPTTAHLMALPLGHYLENIPD
ncbi:unnamed protein product [Dibothriocephalus latus]|uniref:Uncharacterized protein n=1 Tax=Dibothriocephalus latus TaxID=60516 RepID=A0A3P7Q1W7_DIBLA|nr:unnamed protein product [Dibothriocephalus latus]